MIFFPFIATFFDTFFCAFLRREKTENGLAVTSANMNNIFYNLTFSEAAQYWEFSHHNFALLAKFSAE
jgi:hypothetical protein